MARKLNSNEFGCFNFESKSVLDTKASIAECFSFVLISIMFFNNFDLEKNGPTQFSESTDN